MSSTRTDVVMIDLKHLFEWTQSVGLEIILKSGKIYELRARISWGEEDHEGMDFWGPHDRTMALLLDHCKTMGY